MSRARKAALITGITGQDGSYLADLLVAKNYDVYGLVRRSSVPNTERIDHLTGKITLIQGDLTDFSSVREAINQSCPNEIYNLAAQSHVGSSFSLPSYTADVTGVGALNVFEAARRFPYVKIYQAGSSEMFGSSPAPQNEETPFHPRSPYGSAKVFAHNSAVNYRESYGMFISNGILFNHESERRGENFVTRKITKAIGRIASGKQDRLELGNLDAKRDWGHAKDYVYAMWLMLQQDAPDDFVIATGETHTVQEFLEAAFSYSDLLWEDYVVINKDLIRPAEVNVLLGDASKAKRILGWEPTIRFKQLVGMMVEADNEE
jgi:GDPmannose 4,6-dehydratase